MMTSHLSDDDLWLFNEGAHFRLYEKLGAQIAEGDSTNFAVWAPNAWRVSLLADVNGWQAGANELEPIGSSGIWHARFDGFPPGTLYKFHIESRANGHVVDKADPFAFRAEQPPRTASVVWGLNYDWGDADWMEQRCDRNGLGSAITIYEVHLGSWRHALGEHRSLNYRELAEPLATYAGDAGFTHVEFLPVMEHPFYGSWGYQTTGYFAPTSRFGTPQDFMYLIDVLHNHGIGVILDWVPSHFPTDEHGLAFFDGTHLYEHADPRRGHHPDWDSAIFNYDRHEVRSFLLSSAHFWLDRYHVDGLRVDAVASMLYLDYSRRPGEWIPNEFGGNENLGAIQFLRDLNSTVYAEYPDVQMIAEESTAWPMVSRPVEMGGLGFGLKWDMGWMHDTLRYLEREPIHRRFHQDELTFRTVYAFTENFCLPLSHDEVVHGKRSIIGRMPGDRWQQFANVRLLYGYLYGQPGKKLLFMGDEFAQLNEWNHDQQIAWELLEDPAHEGIKRWVRHLNWLLREEPALHGLDFDQEGFSWVDAGDVAASVLSFLRIANGDAREVLVVANFTPVARVGYRIGVPQGGRWLELANSDAIEYGGSGRGNLGSVTATEEGAHGRPFSVDLVLPPLGLVMMAPEQVDI